MPALFAAALLTLACSSSPGAGSSPDSGTKDAVSEAGPLEDAPTGPLLDAIGPDSPAACTTGSSQIPDFYVEAPGTQDTYDGPGVVTEADSTHLTIQPPTATDSGAQFLRVSFTGSPPSVLPALHDQVWVTLRDGAPDFAGYVFAAVRRSQGGELYFSFLRDNLDLYNAGYFSTPGAAGASLSIADGCSAPVAKGCFDNEKDTQLRLTFKADTSVTLGAGETQQLWVSGRLYQVFVKNAVRVEGGMGHCTDTSTGPFVDFFITERPDSVAGCLANGYPCDVCCEKYVDANSSFFPAVHDCACADPGGACRSECGNANSFFCSPGGPAQYKDCVDCLNGIALSPPAGCAADMAACAASAPCAAYVGCLKSCSGG